MRILVVGAGATGGLFGGRLANAGRDVTFLVRPRRAAQLRERGLRIASPLGDFSLAPQIVETGAVSRAYDVILLGLKAYALDSAIDDFAPAVGPQTMILPMLNGMRHIDVLVERFGEEAVLGGVCMVATMVKSDGDIVQLNDMQSLTYGDRSGAVTQRIEALDALMQGAGFGATASDHIVHDMWEKWTVLSTLGAATCLMRGTIGDIEAAGGAPITSAILDQSAAIARAAGYAPRESFLADVRGRFTAAGSPLASSMYRDMQQGNPVEADHILGDLIARGERTGVSTPLLRAVYVQLRIYQKGLA